MKFSACVGILTLAVVIAGIAIALWQFSMFRETQTAQVRERDLFGAPVLGDSSASRSAEVELDQPHSSADAEAPSSKPPGEDIAPPEIPQPPAEPFVPPQITAYG